MSILTSAADHIEHEPAPRPLGSQAEPAKRQPRLTLVISSLVAGGAERVMTELANHWASLGWPVTIIHYSEPGTPPAYPLDPRVTELPLGLHRVSRTWISATTNNMRRIPVLRGAILGTRPDIILSFMANVLTVLSTIGSGIPVIVSERTTWDGELNLPWRVLRRLTYQRATFVVVQTADALEDLPSALRRRGRIIPNPLPSRFLALDPDVEGVAHEANIGRPTIMAMGRLAPEKGFDLLIEAFAQIAPTWPTASLVIWGEGDERPRLERIRAEHHLVERIALPGITRAPETELLSATIFVLSSRREGLPMALIEAMSLGLAVVATDCDHGPRSIIRNGVDGLLVPPDDVDALAEAIGGLLRDDDRRARLAQRAIEVRDRFSIGPISAQWETLFHEAIGFR